MCVGPIVVVVCVALIRVGVGVLQIFAGPGSGQRLRFGHRGLDCPLQGFVAIAIVGDAIISRTIKAMQPALGALPIHPTGTVSSQPPSDRLVPLCRQLSTAVDASIHAHPCRRVRRPRLKETLFNSLRKKSIFCQRCVACFTDGAGGPTHTGSCCVAVSTCLQHARLQRLLQLLLFGRHSAPMHARVCVGRMPQKNDTM
jgi:hypothetical protein